MTSLRFFQRWAMCAAGFIWLVTILNAQTIIVTGLVLHRNRTPAVNYLVAIGAQARYTDVRGRYRIEGIRPGRYKLRITKDGRLVRDGDVEIKGPVMTLNFDVP